MTGIEKQKIAARAEAARMEADIVNMRLSLKKGVKWKMIPGS